MFKKLLSFWIFIVTPGLALDDHRVIVKIDKEVIIAPSGVFNRAMMSMVRSSDGTIFLNGQTKLPKLYMSQDQGESWIPVIVRLDGPPLEQVTQGLGVSRKGRLFLIHQTSGNHLPNTSSLYGQDLFVSYSDDFGKTWITSSTEFGKFSPGIPNMKFHEDGNRTFVEQPNGHLMFTTTIVPAKDYAEKYPPVKPVQPPNYEYGGQEGDLFSDVVFRSTDYGATWGDPSQVYPDLNPHESSLSIDPYDANHLLIITRIQRMGRANENAEKMMMKTGNPRHYWKQAGLFESRDGGRTFNWPNGGFTSWYGHRATICWAQNNVVVIVHNAGYKDPRRLVRLSLDGGETWVNGTKRGTALMRLSKKFKLAREIGFCSPTIEMSPDHFLTAVYRYDNKKTSKLLRGVVSGIFWHIERPQHE